MNLSLRGILDTSLGGYLTFRGFAKLGDIEKLSDPDPAYQRDLITSHAQEISDFLTSGQNLFFPEVILGCRLADNDEMGLLNSFFDALGENRSSAFDFNKLKIAIQTATEFQSGEDSRSIGRYRPSILTFLTRHRTLAASQKPFKRIDGNHRISAAQNAGDNIKNLNVPFCIVFFRDQSEEEKYSRVIFHNINYKSIPLSMEESLKLILSDDGPFSSEELKTNPSFGWAYYFTKQIQEDEVNRYFTNLSGLFDGKFLTTFLKLFKLLLEYEVLKNENDEIAKVRTALSDINTNIYSDEHLKNSKNTAVFSAFLFYQLQKPELINFLKEWVIKNEINKIEELEPKSIIKIMENIANHKVKKVFVAMPYWGHEKVNEYNKMFTEALQEVEKKIALPFKLELIPIMRNKGESERIDQRLLNQIRECDIFIADLTEVNQNVLYETAFAEGSGIKSLLIKEESDASELPFDMDKRQYVPYQKDAYYTKIKSIVQNNLPAMLM